MALNDAFERLRGEGISVVAVSDAIEAASRFEAGTDVILLADGIAPDMSDVGRMTEEGGETMILTVPDDEAHEAFERIDATHRWAGLARLPAALVGATAAMIGDWDLQSTLLRRAVQSGARLVPAANGEGAGPFMADGEAMAGFERRLLLASRGARTDWVSRFILPVVEEVATERLMETRFRPEWLVRAALMLTLGAALAFTRGWQWQGLVALVLATPLDLVARRIALLRLRPLSPTLPAKRLLWPAAGLALLALGWFEARHGGGWGAMVAALSAAAFAEAARIESRVVEPPYAWPYSRAARRSGWQFRLQSAAGGTSISRSSRYTPRRASSSPSIYHHASRAIDGELTDFIHYDGMLPVEWPIAAQAAARPRRSRASRGAQPAARRPARPVPRRSCAADRAGTRLDVGDARRPDRPGRG